MVMSISQFKAAFKMGAEQVNPKIRWAATKNIFLSQTRLASIASDLDDIENSPPPERLQKVLDLRLKIARAKEDRKLNAKYGQLLDDLHKNLADTVVRSQDISVGPPKVSLVKTMAGVPGVRVDDEFVKDDMGTLHGATLTQNKFDYINDLVSKVKTMGSDLGVAIDGLDSLVISAVKDTKLGVDSGVIDGSIWEQAINEVRNNVSKNITKDLAEMKSSGLLGPTATLAGIRFTGSDFHKGGKQVLILRFIDGGKEKKVVYKPSSLAIDAMLFGSDGVASKLEGVDTYRIVPIMTKDVPPEDTGRGYMEFVDTGGGPTGKDDVLDIYASMGGAMAMSYYVGLDDVHQENVLLKKNSLQVIDMEATTGLFVLNTDYLAPKENPEEDDKVDPQKCKKGGWADQLWTKSLEGIRKTIERDIQDGKVTTLPTTPEALNALFKGFSDVIGRMSDPGKGPDLSELEKNLGKLTARFVPIATAEFNNLIPTAQRDNYPLLAGDTPATLDSWTRYIDEELAHRNGALLVPLKGGTSTPLPTIRNLIVAAGAWKALRAGEVPYYTRNLGTNVVRDEDGNPVTIDGHAKSNPLGIVAAMKKRREEDPAAVVKFFKAQMGTLVTDMHEHMIGWLRAFSH